MKSKKVFYIIAPSLLAITTLFGCNSGGFSEKTVKLFLPNSKEIKTQKLYFNNSKDYLDIPYINLSDGINLIETVYKMDDDLKFKINGKADGNQYTYERENGSSLVFNFEYNTIFSENINKYKAPSYAKGNMDIRGISGYFYNDKGEVPDESLIKINQVQENSAIDFKGNQTFIPLSSYNITIKKYGNKYLVPFTTFYNIAGNTSCSLLYNGEDLYLIGGSSPSKTMIYDDGKSQYDHYYSFKPKNRSDALKNYAYNEVIRDLDYTYGLKDTHNIDSFYNLFESSEIKNCFYSDDKYEYNKTFYYLTMSYLADFHSNFTFASPYFDLLNYVEQNNLALSVPQPSNYKQRSTDKVERMTIRSVNRIFDGNPLDLSDKIVNPFLMNEDKTIALITFDRFMITQDFDFYYTEEFKNNKKNYIQTDTLALISYANDQIKNTPTIKKVILDLSANSGGMVDAAIFVLGWLNAATLQIENPVDGYKSTIRYKSDINFDKKYRDTTLTEEETPLDTLNDSNYIYSPNKIKVYCLTTNSSFSCGNYVPAMLKQLNKATIVGTKSGGGACTVHITGTADGSGLWASSSYRFCTEINGSFYNIDKGVEPDIYLDDPNVLYGDGENKPSETSPNKRKNIFDFISTLN